MGIRVGVGMSFCLWVYMDGGDSVWADGRVCIVLISAEYRIFIFPVVLLCVLIDH